MRWLVRIALIVSWMLNLASAAGYLLLRRRMNALQSKSNKLRLHIVRPYVTERNADGSIVTGVELDELQLMVRLFSTAAEYGNAHVVVVANNGDLGLPKIRKLAEPFHEIVQVIEASPMP